MRSVSFILVLIVSIAPTVSADISQILTVNEPPSSFLETNGVVSGFSVDIVREAQKRIGNQANIQILPEARALSIVSNKPNTLLFAFSSTPERKKKFHLITLLFRKPWVLYSRADKPMTIRNLDDAKLSSSIGVVIGDVRERYLSQQGFQNLSKTSTHEQNLKMLRLNRIQLMFYEPLGMAYLCRKLNIPLSAFKPVFNSKVSDVFLMISKNGSSADDVNKWKKVFSDIKEDGTFKRIADKWSKKIYADTGLHYRYREDALDFIHDLTGNVDNSF